MSKIRIIFPNLELKAELNQSKTARLIYNALPIESYVQRWGEEIYFEIPVKAELEKDARAEVEPGELGYWCAGSSFCIFFGPTPASKNDKPKAYEPVNIIGRLLDVPRQELKKIKSKTKVRIEKA